MSIIIQLASIDYDSQVVPVLILLLVFGTMFILIRLFQRSYKRKQQHTSILVKINTARTMSDWKIAKVKVEQYVSEGSNISSNFDDNQSYSVLYKALSDRLEYLSVPKR